MHDFQGERHIWCLLAKVVEHNFLNILKTQKHLMRDTYFVDCTVVQQFSIFHFLVIPPPIWLPCRQDVIVNPFQLSKYENS